MPDWNILSADIGGTHSRFAHFTADSDGGLKLIEVKWLKTTDVRSFGELLDKLRESGASLRPEEADIVVIAIAGPIEAGVKSSPPFISWTIDLSNAREEHNFKRSALINDFVAQAYACRTPAGEAAEEVLPGEAAPGAAIGAIGAGTGLGKAVLIQDGKGGYIALPSEGGHANFPFVSQQECQFQEFLLRERRDKYITGNIVVSGRGLSYIHQFLNGERLKPEEVAERIVEHPETSGWMSKFYGRACRNFVLETLALGGLYIAGGVAARIPELVTGKDFELEFRSSDTLAHLLSKVPVFLVKDENSGLWGGAFFGRQLLKSG
ncbi:MAG: glucokinase [Candidatus Sulfobium sp.]|jgi:glucokinase